MQQTQLDLFVRWWITKKFHFQYYSSAFLLYCTANQMTKPLLTGIQGLKPENVIKISMDGSNVHLAVAKNFEAETGAAGFTL